MILIITGSQFQDNCHTSRFFFNERKNTPGPHWWTFQWNYAQKCSEVKIPPYSCRCTHVCMHWQMLVTCKLRAHSWQSIHTKLHERQISQKAENDNWRLNGENTPCTKTSNNVAQPLQRDTQQLFCLFIWCHYFCFCFSELDFHEQHILFCANAPAIVLWINLYPVWHSRPKDLSQARDKITKLFSNI